MSSASVKLHFLDDVGEVQQKRFVVSDDSLTVAAAIQRGLVRLQIPQLPCQLKMTAHKRGRDKEYNVELDDYIEMDHDYIFVDPRINASSSSTEHTTMAATESTTPTTSRSSFVRMPASAIASPASPKSPFQTRMTFARPPAEQSTPTSSRPTSVRNGEATRTPISLPSTPHRPVYARTNAKELDEQSSTYVSLSAQTTPSSSAAVAKFTPLSKTKRMHHFYAENIKDIDALYASKKESVGRMFHDACFFLSFILTLCFFQIDVIEKFGLFQHWKAAFFVLCQQTNPELYEAAVYVLTDACFDILRSLWPKLNVIPAEKQMLAQLVSGLTGYGELRNITMANRNGTLDYKVKHFRRQHPETSADSQPPSAKRMKMSTSAVELNAEIDLLSIELNPESDSKVLHRMYEASALQRSSWEKHLHADPNLSLGIITKLVSKFRHVTSDISLLQYDYKILMSGRRTVVKSLSDAFRRLQPAIYQMARNLELPEAEAVYDSPDESEYMAGTLLVAILKKKCKKSALDYSRLVIDHSDSFDHRAAMEKRKADGITAPTILIIGSAPAVSFYVAADDIVFKVRGRFADALQSYMELVFVSNVKYDKNTTGISYFFEYLMNIKEHQNTSRMAVCKELEELAATLTNPVEVRDQSPARDEENSDSFLHDP